MLNEITRNLMEPIDRIKYFIDWDAGAGRTVREKELAGRIRATVNSVLKGSPFYAILRFQSHWRLNLPEEQEQQDSALNLLAERIEEWKRIGREGDNQWWELTRVEFLSDRRFRQLFPDRPIPHDSYGRVPNPYYGDTSPPNLEGSYVPLKMGETATGEAYGLKQEMDTLAKWAESIVESYVRFREVDGGIQRGQHTAVVRKLETLREFLELYDPSAPRYQEVIQIMDEAQKLETETEALIKVTGKRMIVAEEN